MGRLLGTDTKGVQADRRAAAEQAASDYGCPVLLKGARTLMADPDGRLAVNLTSNPGMATGGSGDVLSGVIAALLAAKLGAWEAAAAGAFLHGLAGDLVAAGQGGPAGLIATDLIDRLPAAIARCQTEAPPLMTRLFAFFLLLVTVSAASAAPPLTLTLPDSGAYSYWTQSKAGAVLNLPVNVSRTKTVKIVAPLAAGDRLLVLDAHTGEVATRVVSVGAGNAPAPIALSVADFLPVASPAAVAAPPLAAAAAPPPPAPDRGGGVGRLVTALFSLILAGGVVWVLVQLVKTRGEPLREVARRLGVETAEPAPLEADDPEKTVAYTPTKRAPEPVPEEAGLAVAPGAHPWSPRAARRSRCPADPP